MLYSSVEKLNLVQWLFRNNRKAFENSLKVQKFLFFYELFAKVTDNDYDLERLSAYDLGPVFTSVYGDYRHSYQELVNTIDGVDIIMENKINYDIVAKANFLVSTENTQALSTLTHKFDAWKERYVPNTHNTPIHESDFSQRDIDLAVLLFNGYDVDMIKNSEILYLDPAKFVFNKGESEKLTKEQKEALEEVATSGDIDNPMFVTIADDGVLEID